MNISARRSRAKHVGLFFQLPGSRLLCALLASLLVLLPSLAGALPSEGHVVAGQATIHDVSPTTLSIAQASDKAILNWNSFSIAANEAVHFIQPSVSSIALNRVIGIDPSVILGQLQANGRIFLINPNGILFGAGAQINVGGLLATTLQTRDDDFMAGRYLFAQDPLKGLKTVVNRGTIHVSDNGYVVLMAPGVSNEGVIVANLGTALLGSGQKFTLDLMGDGLIRYAINDKVLGQVTGPDGKPLSSAVNNSGTIQADGGQVILSARASGDVFSSVVNQSGVIRARSLVNRDGIVRLEGGDTGLVQVAGTLDASGAGAGERGGQGLRPWPIGQPAGFGQDRCLRPFRRWNCPDWRQLPGPRTGIQRGQHAGGGWIDDQGGCAHEWRRRQNHRLGERPYDLCGSDLRRKVGSPVETGDSSKYQGKTRSTSLGA